MSPRLAILTAATLTLATVVVVATTLVAVAQAPETPSLVSFAE